MRIFNCIYLSCEKQCACIIYIFMKRCIIRQLRVAPSVICACITGNIMYMYNGIYFCIYIALIIIQGMNQCLIVGVYYHWILRWCLVNCCWLRYYYLYLEEIINNAMFYSCAKNKFKHQLHVLFLATVSAKLIYFLILLNY